MDMPLTVGQLRRSGYNFVSIKDEMRRNLIAMIERGQELFPGIIGYEQTVIPQLQNAILSKHNFILLGLRGQAKSRILRSLTRFLDERIPTIRGCEINDNPLAPVCKGCRRRTAEKGDDLEIEWISREDRYREKLATPDVTIADLIGDIDPIKAATQRLTYADEEVIHYGIVPRSNRGIFAINELPDLQPRIQVGLLNILEERDLQIRGFPVRIPLDIVMVFSANPEDYTNRGSIITPLKDRIDSQIMTHYPHKMEDALSITEQEAWVMRDGNRELIVPPYVKEIAEEIAFQARKSDLVDQTSGVSARLPISALEILLSNMERRAIRTGEKKVFPRICDLYAMLPAVTGKIELVYEGEREGTVAVGRKLIGAAINKMFRQYFPQVQKSKTSKEAEPAAYKPVTDWFARGNRVEVSDEMTFDEYYNALKQVKGLREVAATSIKSDDPREVALAMEWILDGLHQNQYLMKEDLTAGTSSYSDILKAMLERMEDTNEV